LWAVWPVEVRVLFGAWKSPAPGGAFFVLGRRAIGRRSAWDQTGLVRAVRCVRQRPDQPLDAVGCAAQEDALAGLVPERPRRLLDYDGATLGRGDASTSAAAFTPREEE
jgi:hypothetical protein